MNVYDRVVPNNAVETLWALAIGVVLVLGADLFMRLLRSHFVDEASARVDVQLSAVLMEKVLGMRLKHRAESVGSFAANLRGLEQVRDFIASSIVTTLIDLPFALLFVFVMLWISPWLALPVDDGRVDRLQHARLAGARAGRPDRRSDDAVPGRAHRAREPEHGDGQAGRAPGRSGLRRAAATARRDRVSQRQVRVSRSHRFGAGRPELQDRSRREGRADRSRGLRQIDDPAAHHGALPAARGRGAARRHRPAPARPGRPAPQLRLRVARCDAVLRLAAREHRVRPALCRRLVDRRRGRTRGNG